MISTSAVVTNPIVSRSKIASPDDTSSRTNRESRQQATRADARQVSGRRRFVDPTSCEGVQEFMQAMQEYKRTSGRMFPTWSEVLEVLHALGYQKQA